jgi:hypothetical protein
MQIGDIVRAGGRYIATTIVNGREVPFVVGRIMAVNARGLFLVKWFTLDSVPRWPGRWFSAANLLRVSE